MRVLAVLAVASCGRVDFAEGRDDPGGFGDILVGNAPLPLGEWHRVAITWDHLIGEKRAWLDGQVVAEDLAPARSTTSSSTIASST